MERSIAKCANKHSLAMINFDNIGRIGTGLTGYRISGRIAPTFSGSEARSGVSKRPGATVFTRMPVAAKSRARGSVIPKKKVS